jgi:superfamily II DNA/RNA helicase
MASSRVWQDPGDLSIINEIVRHRIPEWTDGLYPFQSTAIPLILNGQDLLCCTPTGDGKSALFIVPILVHEEICKDREKYGAWAKNAKEWPVGIVVTPTNGLASKTVCFLTIPCVKVLA